MTDEQRADLKWMMRFALLSKPPRHKGPGADRFIGLAVKHGDLMFKVSREELDALRTEVQTEIDKEKADGHHTSSGVAAPSRDQ